MANWTATFDCWNSFPLTSKTKCISSPQEILDINVVFIDFLKPLLPMSTNRSELSAATATLTLKTLGLNISWIKSYFPSKRATFELFKDAKDSISCIPLDCLVK